MEPQRGNGRCARAAPGHDCCGEFYPSAHCDWKHAGTLSPCGILSPLAPAPASLTGRPYHCAFRRKACSLFTPSSQRQCPLNSTVVSHLCLAALPFWMPTTELSSVPFSFFFCFSFLFSPSLPPVALDAIFPGNADKIYPYYIPPASQYVVKKTRRDANAQRPVA